MPDNYNSEIRKQLLAAGYEIIPNYDKATFLPGWNAKDYEAVKVVSKTTGATRWEVRFPKWLATGVRVTGRLRVIDIDINHPLIDQVLDKLCEILGYDAYDEMPARYGKSNFKVALFCKAPEGDEAFTILGSHKYFAGTEAAYKAEIVRLAGTGKDPETHRLELFGGGPTAAGKVSKQVGIYGPHSHNDDGSVAAEYCWAEHGLHEVPIGELPLMSKAQALEFIDATDAICKAAGWFMVSGQRLAPTGKDLFDITEESRFDVYQGDDGVTYAELCELFEARPDLRVSSSFLGEASENRSKCQVHWSKRHDCVGIHNHEEAANHYPAEQAPRLAKLGIDIESLMKAPLDRPDDAEPAPPADDANNADKALWLLLTHGYFPQEDKVIRLYDTSFDGCRIRPIAFDRSYAAWFEQPKRGKAIAATELWMKTPQRLRLEGVRMRPHMTFPTFVEDDKTYKNIYRRPVLAEAGGDVAPFLAFLERFLPDERERNFLLDWLAHKQWRPEIPGTAIVFVAETPAGAREEVFGTGRGLLFSVVYKLFGENYCRPQSFAVLSGTSGQAAYTDWLHGSIMVTVDESKASPTSYQQRERTATYEILKHVVDPAPKRHRFTVKNGQAFEDMSYCSFMVASNHADALAIPEHDRRFTVLTNGRKMTQEEAIAFVAWTANPDNIGALSRFLAARDLSAFQMHEPLMTEGKRTMAQHAIGEVEDIVMGLEEDDSRGKVFLKKHFEDHVGRNFGHANWRGEFMGVWKRYCVGIKTEAGAYRTVRQDGTKKKLFCLRVNEQLARSMPEAALRREASKWGLIEGTSGNLGGTQLLGTITGSGTSTIIEPDQEDDT